MATSTTTTTTCHAIMWIDVHMGLGPFVIDTLMPKWKPTEPNVLETKWLQQDKSSNWQSEVQEAIFWKQFQELANELDHWFPSSHLPFATRPLSKSYNALNIYKALLWITFKTCFQSINKIPCISWHRNLVLSINCGLDWLWSWKILHIIIYHPPKPSSGRTTPPDMPLTPMILVGKIMWYLVASPYYIRPCNNPCNYLSKQQQQQCQQTLHQNCL